ncbi:NAD(P)/FAD-dependent oxidoreductase [Nafulsella turpanensis]|uniref:NAD(P)/FAD-dependent oxidoreductase n=1 Tax=Nafulsella turpanensis TaxID=1265690 RepID=UPI000349F82A|nr:FAD-dependent oxidoreductase [Nafulsella turpanensis]
MKTDYLIIGHGIAGAVLSFQLLQAGFQVKVIGKKGITVSSEVAAGLFNPVTGRKMVKTWHADPLFAEIEPVYRKMEALSGSRFLHFQPIYRPFTDRAEQNDWASRQGEPAYAPYIAEVFDKPRHQPYVKNPFGGLLLKQSGWLDIPTMLAAWKQYLMVQDSFIEEEFNETELQVEETFIRYKGTEARGIIYCNGTGIMESRYWHWVPLRPVKGEVLHLHSSIQLDEIINRGVFLLPQGNGRYKLGSTYDQRNHDLNPTEAARKEMLERLASLIDMPINVEGQEVGIRPATKDRRPVAGQHPQHQTLLIFNGLGTKGVSLAPYCAGILAAYLLQQKEILAEININRFFSLYYS